MPTKPPVVKTLPDYEAYYDRFQKAHALAGEIWTETMNMRFTPNGKPMMPVLNRLARYMAALTEKANAAST